VRAGLRERDAQRWHEVIGILEQAEDAGVRREFDTARGLIDRAVAKLQSP